MNKVLLTGATGFVGSTLAASFLARNVPIVVLSRNDPDGERTKSAILNAAKGFGFDIGQAIDRHFQVVNVDFADFAQSIPASALADVTIAWHCSAEMSYSVNKLSSSFETNVCCTVQLFNALRAASSKLQRFYYMSTSYVAGMRGGPVDARLHADSKLINPYQVTKWSAEHALHLLHLETGIPVTIFRPSVVVGHRKSGWTFRNGFGFYMFIDAFRAFNKAGYDSLTLDIKPEVRPDFIPIDRLADDVIDLTLQTERRKSFEVFHCTGGLTISTQETLRLMGVQCNVRVSYGKPVTSIEQRFDRATETNKPFANVEWVFSRESLDHLLGREPAKELLTIEQITRIIRWYLELEPQDATSDKANVGQAALAN